MYSDRIHHAFAFAAKHFPERVSRYDGQSCLIRTSSVAVVLARYGADESTIVAGILKQLVDASPYASQAPVRRTPAASQPQVRRQSSGFGVLVRFGDFDRLSGRLR